MLSKKKNIAKVYGGAKAKNNGDAFERLIEKKCTQESIFFIKIPSGCKWVKTPYGVRPVPIRTPFDYIILKNGSAVFFDAKSLSNSALSHSKIKPHQMDKLVDIEKQKFISGYIVHFVEENKIEFFISSKLKNLRPRNSLYVGDGVELGNKEDFSLLPLLENGD